MEIPNDMIKIFMIMMLCIVYLFSGIFGAQAENDGLQISISTDRANYVKGDTAWLTLKIDNPTNQDYYDLDIRHLLPTGLQYVPDEYGQHYVDIVKAHSTYTCTIGVKHPSPNVSVTVNTSKTKYSYDESAMLTVTVQNNTNEPVYELELHHLIPEGLEYAELTEDGYAYIDVLSAFGTVSRTFVLNSMYPDVLVTLEADQAVYKPGETASLRVTVKNRSDSVIKDIDIQHYLPEGMVYAIDNEHNQFQFAVVYPGETVQGEVYVQYIENAQPQTGDYSLRWFSVLLISVAALITLKRIADNGGKIHA